MRCPTMARMARKSPRRRGGRPRSPLSNSSFTPVEIQVKAGTTITWTNQDDIPHTVVIDTKAFKSGVLDTDDNFSFKFDTPGDYVYFCSVHPRMTGHIKVMP